MSRRILDGNRIDLLTSGKEFFTALLVAINAAQHEIHLETYIFRVDTTGEQILVALEQAARRGVSVKVLVDGFGSRDAIKILRQRLEAAGGILLAYRPVISMFSALRRNRLRRLHRKITVVDARIAYVGGINIIDDDYLFQDGSVTLDFAVRIEGPLIQDIYATVTEVWARAIRANFKARRQSGKALTPDITPKGVSRAALITRDNVRNRRTIERAYLDGIASAKNEILIANAYFFPGRHFRRALVKASRRGVKITLLLQGLTDHTLMQYATRALYGPLLDAGVRIFEYNKSFLHAKVAVIDGSIATVGSSNIDPFSLLLAREANVVVFDAPFATKLYEQLQEAMRVGATELPHHSWKRQPLLTRIRMWLSYGCVRWAMGLCGIRGRESGH